ncbi:MAG: RdgB/HAM1 family non-canonical purine NTP pyrophosphatase [Verrucomicrobia bacterium]|nr:RdgB/HAM1 family non-canonical purine NTP pyrophosphatase [Verrucomicrobiota bacterium]MBV8481585.1 RdgB/HAM1 family non-canonical purine NTP pyrophosphatase [Verrucomicrobiota bacterium]
MQTLLVATWNTHKTKEIGQILGSGWNVRDLTTLVDAPRVEETGSTFAENAALKAVAISGSFSELVLADDSGLEVDALNGDPGVYSARYAGEDATDAQNRSKLIGLLKTLPAREFNSRFRCEMVLASKGEIKGSFSGAVEGIVVPLERGDHGFGYDSMFIPAGYRETFAELPSAIKNSLSHRARALDQVVAFLQNKGVQEFRSSE